MTLTPGTRIGSYEILSLIGTGGMGEVYRATDTDLERQVAIKVLPEAFATDPERLARFEREAKTLAALNHPNIAQIYGLERSTGIHALIMELVEGPTLADRIAHVTSHAQVTSPTHVGRVPPPVRRSLGEGGSKGEGMRHRPAGLPIDETLAIAKQIADALEAAHERGIIHRDLKPANIKLRPDGVVKVLDFGLAKALDPAPSATDVSQLPTITSPAMMTGMGVLLGTAAYMSPEQARGETVDKRADIWAFGCVLYEMLTGKRLFEGATVSDTLAFVLTKDPDWTVLPPKTPASIRRLLRRCLEKDRRRRLDSASAVRIEIDDVSAPVQDAVIAEASGGRAWSWRRPVSLALATVGVAATASFVVWVLMRPSPAPVVRLAADSGPELVVVALGGPAPDVDIAPDGRHIVYFTNQDVGQRQLNVRALDQLTSSPLYAGPVSGVFMSPDGQWVGFADRDTLKKTAIGGGPPVTICKLPVPGLDGASWGEDDTIVFSGMSNHGLWRVSATGGNPEMLTTPDRQKGEEQHVRPQILPGGKAVLFDIVPASGAEGAQIAVLDLQTAERKVLVRGGTTPRYAASGHLVYGVAGTLWAVAFDLARLELIGNAVPLVESVAMNAAGRASFSLARNGTLVYRQAQSVRRTLAWMNRQGREEAIAVPPRAYSSLTLSPDGTRVALGVSDEQNDIWVWDLSRQALTRLTFDPGDNRGPVWAPDGRRLAFSAARDGAENIYWQSADGSGTEEPLTTSDGNRQLIPMAFSPDGNRLLFRGSGPPRNIEVVTLDGGRDVNNLLQTPFDEFRADVSPDGRWLAYESNESGRSEIYVRPFPDVNAGRWQASTEGGTEPLWARSGRELFYLAPKGEVMAVPVQPSSTFATGPPQVVVKGNDRVNPSGADRSYAVSPDGRRFLMMKDVTPASEAAAPPQLIVVLNFHEELKRLAPTN
ncbi:MAG: protein kinase domain-containing protein [Vicinamibacterales bacterium]